MTGTDLAPSLVVALAAAGPPWTPTAEAVVQGLLLPATCNHYYSLCSTEGEGPGKDSGRWESLFATCYPAEAPVLVQ